MAPPAETPHAAPPKAQAPWSFEAVPEGFLFWGVRDYLV